MHTVAARNSLEILRAKSGVELTLITKSVNNVFFVQASGKGGRGFGHVFFAEFSQSDDDELRVITGGVGHVKFWTLNGRCGNTTAVASLSGHSIRSPGRSEYWYTCHTVVEYAICSGGLLLVGLNLTVQATRLGQQTHIEIRWNAILRVYKCKPEHTPIHCNLVFSPFPCAYRCTLGEADAVLCNMSYVLCNMVFSQDF